MNLVAALGFYALLSLDGVAWVPTLLGRPVVVGPLVGACLGGVAWWTGAWGGLVLELFWPTVVASRWFRLDWGFGAALCAVLGTFSSGDKMGLPSGILGAVIFSVPAVYGARWLDRLVLRGNEKLTAGWEQDPGSVTSSNLWKAWVLSSFFWCLRSILLLVLFGGLAFFLFPYIKESGQGWISQQGFLFVLMAGVANVGFLFWGRFQESRSPSRRPLL